MAQILFAFTQETFRETPSEATELEIPPLLRGVPLDTPIMMYCTGGIRCDIYSPYLKSKGYKNLYSLEGGVAKYLREEGAQHWKGSLFVFDGRMAVLPGGVLKG